MRVAWEDHEGITMARYDIEDAAGGLIEPDIPLPAQVLVEPAAVNEPERRFMLAVLVASHSAA